MNCAKAKDFLPDLLDPSLADFVPGEIRQHVEHCNACRAELGALRQTLEVLDRGIPNIPSERLRDAVAVFIGDERSSARTGLHRKEPGFHWKPRWLLAGLLGASCLLAIGFWAGSRLGAAGRAKEESDTKRQLADLQTQMNSVGRLVGYSLLQSESHSTNERLESVLAAGSAAKSTPRLVENLLDALALDPSANVRLSALDALYAHADEPAVRKTVLSSLARETNPLVQVSLIDFLVATRDREAEGPLEQLSNDAQANGAVRAEALRALAQL